MKNNFMKKLKKGICVGMAGTMIITGSAGHVGVHPVMRVEASTADITTAKTKEEATKILCSSTDENIKLIGTLCVEIQDLSHNLKESVEKSDCDRIMKIAICSNLEERFSDEQLEYTQLAGLEFPTSLEEVRNQYETAETVILNVKKGREYVQGLYNVGNIGSMMGSFLSATDNKYSSMLNAHHEIEKNIKDYNTICKFFDSQETETPIATSSPNPTTSAEYSTIRTTKNIKSNEETYIESCILTYIRNEKENIRGSVFGGICIMNGHSFGCDKNSTVTIKNITLSNGKTFPDITFSVGTADFTYELDLTSFEDYIIPTIKPTIQPTMTPTVTPIIPPTIEATVTPTMEPTILPTAEPTVIPTIEPTIIPTTEPTVIPTTEPTVIPTVEPTIIPTTEPTVMPTVEPTIIPTIEPTVSPTTEPTIVPTMLPTAEPQVPTQPAVTAKPICLRKKTIKIGRGEKVTVPLNNGTGKKITYSSKNKKIATVTKKGIVKGVKTGTTTIYIKANGKKYSLKVMVKKKPVKIKITSVKSVKMGIGDKLILQAVLNKGAASYSLKWKSSNKKVVTVNSQGVATIKGKGKATITVQTYNGVKAKLNLKIK